ncbi:MAG: hypothetical protein KGI19_09145 [Thaumarchaeota archaeon]|nr:hypothetical protein [Nitrososphaerota archaeon]
MKKKTIDAICSIEFRKFLDQIPQNDPRKMEFLEAFKILKKDCLRGNKISHVVDLMHILKNTG